MVYVSMQQERVSTSISSTSIKGIKYYDNIIGPCLCLFGKALKVFREPFEDDSTAIYFNKNSLVKQLFWTTNRALDLDSLKTTWSVHKLVMQILNPIKGKPITIADVSCLFDLVRIPEYRKIFDTCAYEHEAIEAMEERLRFIRHIHLEAVPYEPRVLRRKLQIGDVFCRRINDDYHNNVVTAQKVEKLFIKEPKERDADNYSHLAMYLGNGFIAEAAWPTGRGDEIRILRLEDSRFAIERFSHFQYVVARCKNLELAKEAANVACKIADYVGGLNSKKNQHTRLRYSIPLALQCVLFPSTFGPFAKERYLEQYADDIVDALPRDFLSPTGLFCSYLVGLAYQVAESKQVCPKILGYNDGPEEDEALTDCGGALRRQIWAKIRRWQYYTELDREVKFQFDARRISPQNFRNFIKRHPDLFEDIMIISKD